MGRTESAAGQDTPGKESVYNRFAGRPEPMVWRPFGETVSWDGPGIAAVVRPVDAIDRSWNTLTTVVS